MSQTMRDFLNRAREQHWSWTATAGGKLAMTHEALDKPFFVTTRTASHSSNFTDAWNRMQRLLRIHEQTSQPPAARTDPPPPARRRKPRDKSTAPAQLPPLPTFSHERRPLAKRPPSFEPAILAPPQQGFSPTELLAWALAVVRLRAAGHDWQVIGVLRRRFRDDDAYRREIVGVVHHTSVGDFLALHARLRGIPTRGAWANVHPETALPVAMARVQWRRQARCRPPVCADGEQPQLPAAYGLFAELMDDAGVEMPVRRRLALT